ncbi:hypothetical protein LOTGIDRAFT_238252 [Lottia gigantea]|uniref:PEHE domain-containing protein n=1 Tax=Lottia gigantea TaxID=225164 RepID=V4B649_LOTGI|nr:hypothetical protein LOTGIDRAFT_238252 [Lottia gigantea]ESP01567.1 hypothetical protein LOTGIDRAFT_238252 [Lottia gigantea]
MKSEFLNEVRNKCERRPYLQRRRMTKPVHYKNGDFDSDLAFAMQESLQMAREKENELSGFENCALTNGGVLDEIPAVKMAGKINNSGDSGNREADELREMLLIHLELIQQQGDVIEQKDREIKELKSEKIALECRLERMERRMSLLKQKEELHEPTDTKENQDVASTPKQEKGLKRKATVHLSSPTPSKFLVKKHAGPGRPAKIKTENSIRKSREILVKDSPEIVTDTPLSRLRHPSVTEEEQTVLKTDCVYHVSQAELRSRHIEIIDPEESKILAKSLKEIEVPSWRKIKYTNLYQMEGTENLEDDTIIKRHQKPELEEKRRKRWDMQRMREQKAAKKLREKDHVISPIHNIETANDIDSFLPILDDISHIEISDELPVIAFGHPLPSLQSQEFQLPWDYDRSTLSKRHTGSRSRRK